jgi:hypothetical protein
MSPTTLVPAPRCMCSEKVPRALDTGWRVRLLCACNNCVLWASEISLRVSAVLLRRRATIHPLYNARKKRGHRARARDTASARLVTRRDQRCDTVLSSLAPSLALRSLQAVERKLTLV